ncbi:MAG: PAS domain S-box protein [Deltaproteobacteria bacterium]|nr:PAS domain S-box protein [Deltaproteobacteria bacterium]
MTKSFRILILADNPIDAELIQAELRKARGVFTTKVVMTEKDFVQELQEFSPDLILADDDLSQYDGALALAEARSRCPDTPFIMVTGTVGEDRAIEILTQGAKDYVLKSRLKQRLSFAVRRALTEAEGHRARKQAEDELREAHRTMEMRVKARTLDLETEIAVRKQTEDALRESEKAFRRLAQESELISEIGRIISSTLDIDEVYERFAEKVREIIPFDSITINIINLKNNTRTIRYNSGIQIKNRKIGDVIPLDGSVTGKVAHSRSSLFLTIKDKEELLRQYPGVQLTIESGIQSMMLIPLIANDEVIALFNLRSITPNAYTENDLRLAERVGSQIAGAIANAQLFLEHKHVEKALRKSENLYRRIVETSLEGIWNIDEEFQTTYVNQRMADMLGYTPEETLGRKVESFLFEEDLEDYSAKVATRRRGVGEVFERRFRRKDGSPIWTLVSSTPDLDGEGRFTGTFSMFTDITERKQAQEACRISEEKYRSIYENALEGIYQITPDGRLLSANPALARMIGFETPEEMVASITDVVRQFFVHPEVLQELMGLFKKKGVIVGFECEAYRRDGTVIWILINAHAIKSGAGEIIYHEGTMEDITKRKEMEEQLRQAYLVLHETNDRLIEADKLAAVGTLAAGVAHEILNPVNIISVGIATLESTQALSEPVKEAFDIFRRQIDRVIKITRELQQFSRRSAGEVELTYVRKLIRDTLSLCEPRIKVENITLEIGDDDALPKIAVDHNRMEQVFLNIINNAMDAMAEKDNKVLHINMKDISEPGTGTNRVLVAISDQGGGIPVENLDRIFDPFFTTKKVGKGTGLGLSISHNIVQNHGGRIWAENNSSGGATFFVELPAELE